MPWHLFLDDERKPHRKGWIATLIGIFQGEPILRVARTYDQAVRLCNKYGCPDHIYFDHDLGVKSRGNTGHTFAHWLVTRDLDRGGFFIPPRFSFTVHSQNSVGKANIEGLLNIYLMRKKNGSVRENRKLYE